jgi:diguanylate cyclase (GGDEF)-like protein/putative nucleotidyltransferase with HDIG domain
MHNILVVDDNKTNLQLIKQVLIDKYAVTPVLSGAMALHYLEKHRPDLILLDYLMPEMDGKETMKAIRENSETAKIPIIIITADNASGTEAECLRLGATDFITKPFVPEVMLSRIEKTIELESYRHDLQQQLNEKSREIEQVTLQAITAVANTIDTKDTYAKGHSIRVAEYAGAIARELGFSYEEIQNLQYVALLHDIGKIGVPDNILNKPSKLTQKEYEIVMTHTTIGADVLKDIQMIREVKEGAMSHHERYDGKGYPAGLKGDEIPVIARILCLADAYDAMTSTRVYRKSITTDQAIAEIEKGIGTQFDPGMARTFIKLLEEGLIISTYNTKKNEQENSFIKESSLLLQRVMKEREAKVEREAAKDYLTGLFNRKAAEVQVNQFLREKENKGSFFIMDLDNFKSVNDTYGHIAGDYALKNVSVLLLNNARDSDVVCRLGGDEFVIFFKGLVQRDILMKKAKKLIFDYNQLKHTDTTLAKTSLSIGIALSGIDGEDFESLYIPADKSLYYVKQNGKNFYHFYSDDPGENEVERENATLVDIQHLMEIMKETGDKKGVLAVGYGEFQRIFNFIQRCVERTKQEVQVLLFTISHNKGAVIVTEVMEESVEILENAIIQSLRRSDVSTRYSSSQFIVVLINSNYEGAQIVVNRIADLFDEMNQHETIVLSKDIAQVTGNSVGK